ncbi:MAG: polysaccharide lyase [Hyphomicrobium sp.]
MRKNISKETVAFNAAGAVVLAIVVGYVGTSMVGDKEALSCSQRYPVGQLFSLHNAKGNILTPIELQARLPRREWGLLANADIVRDDAKKDAVLEIKLASTENEDVNTENGVGFVWRPTDLNGAKTACLTYGIYLPEDFSFDLAGHLPALYAIDNINDLEATKTERGFISRVGWRKDGDLGVLLRNPTDQGAWLSARGMKIEGGRWLSIEQEVRLNTPGKTDGLIRVWIDGEMKIDGRNLNLGGDPGVAIQGVVGDVGYLRPKEDDTPLVKMTRFSLQWQ